MADLIEMPDGTSVDMTGAPPEAHAALRRRIEEQVAAMPKPPGKLEQFGRDVLSVGADAIRGAGKGLMSLVEGAANTGITSSAVDLLGLPRPKGLTASPGVQAVEAALPTPADSSTARRYLRGGVEGAAGAAVTGLSLPQVVGGLTAGVATEAAKTYAPNNPLAQGVAGVAGGLAGGGAAAFATRVRPQTAAIAKEALEGISENDLFIASNYMAKAKAEGTPIDLAQALVATKGEAGNLESIRNALAHRSQGNEVQRILREQPESLRLRSELEVNDLPGTNWGMQQNANNTQEAASLAIKAAKDSRGAAVKGLYAEAGDLPPEARSALGRILNQYATQPGATDLLKARAKELATKLLGNDPKYAQAIAEAQTKLTQATTIPAKQQAREALATANRAAAEAKAAPLHALDVDTWIAELRGPYQGGIPLKVSHPKEQGQIKGLAGALNKRFQELSPEVAKAETRFRSLTETEINPLLQGPVGQLAGRGYDPATKAAMSNFNALLDRGTESNNLSPIRTAAKALGKTDPDAFESSFKGWLEGKINSASSSPSQGRSLGETDARKLYEELFNKPAVWRGVRDAAETMAEIRGVDPASYVRGLENFKQLTKAMTSMARPTGLSPDDLKRLGGSSTTADLVRMASFLPMNKAGERIERATLGNTLSQFDTILASPEGAKMLVELGKVPVMSKKAQVIMGTLGGMVGNPPQVTKQ